MLLADISSSILILLGFSFTMPEDMDGMFIAFP